MAPHFQTYDTGWMEDTSRTRMSHVLLYGFLGALHKCCVCKSRAAHHFLWAPYCRRGKVPALPYKLQASRYPHWSAGLALPQFFLWLEFVKRFFLVGPPKRGSMWICYALSKVVAFWKSPKNSDESYQRPRVHVPTMLTRHYTRSFLQLLDDFPPCTPKVPKKKSVASPCGTTATPSNSVLHPVCFVFAMEVYRTNPQSVMCNCNSKPWFTWKRKMRKWDSVSNGANSQRKQSQQPSNLAKCNTPRYKVLAHDGATQRFQFSKAFHQARCTLPPKHLINKWPGVDGTRLAVTVC